MYTLALNQTIRTSAVPGAPRQVPVMPCTFLILPECELKESIPGQSAQGAAINHGTPGNLVLPNEKCLPSKESIHVIALSLLFRLL